jgi:hypothetical protein
MENISLLALPTLLDPRFKKGTFSQRSGTKMAEAFDDLPKPKKPRIEKRNFIPVWKKEFPWVIWNKDNGMRCQYCMDG